MLIDKLARKHPLKSDTVRMIAQGTLAALIVSVATVVVSQLLGLSAPPGVGAVLGAVCGCSYIAQNRRR